MQLKYSKHTSKKNVPGNVGEVHVGYDTFVTRLHTHGLGILIQVLDVIIDKVN